MKLQANIRELQEMAFMAKRDNNQDLLEMLEDEIAEAAGVFESEVIKLDNEYMTSCPMDQQLSNNINNLIAYFGRDKVENMFTLFFKMKS